MKNIPKILHTYWDKSPMSWLQSLTAVSFNKYNPDWKINVYVPKQSYTGKDKYIPNYTGKDYFHIVENTPNVTVVEVDLNDYGIDQKLHNILRSDILRYYMLYNHGGVWSDFDVLWLRPMTYFYNIQYYGNTSVDEIRSVVSLINDINGGHSIGVMIHCQKDEYIKALIDLTKKVKPPYSHEVFGSVMISRKYPTLDSLSGFDGLVGVKHETYYPYNIHPPKPTIDDLYLKNNIYYINTNVLCLHWYNGKEVSKRYINGDGLKRNCSMTTIIKNEGYTHV